MMWSMEQSWAVGVEMEGNIPNLSIEIVEDDKESGMVFWLPKFYDHQIWLSVMMW